MDVSKSLCDGELKFSFEMKGGGGDCKVSCVKIIMCSIGFKEGTNTLFYFSNKGLNVVLRSISSRGITLCQLKLNRVSKVYSNISNAQIVTTTRSTIIRLITFESFFLHFLAFQ